MPIADYCPTVTAELVLALHHAVVTGYAPGQPLSRCGEGVGTGDLVDADREARCRLAPPARHGSVVMRSGWKTSAHADVRTSLGSLLVLLVFDV